MMIFLKNNLILHACIHYIIKIKDNFSLLIFLIIYLII